MFINRYLMAFARNHVGRVGLTCVLQFVLTLMGSFVSLGIAIVVRMLQGEERILFFSAVWQVFGVIAILIVLRYVLIKQKSLAAERCGLGIKKDVRMGLLNKLFMLGPAFINRERTGNIASSISTKVEYMERFFRANDEYAQASMAYAERRSDESRRITLVMEAASLAADIAAVLLVTSGQIPALWLMPVFVLSSAIFTPILDALSMSTNYGLIFGAAQRVLGLFAEKPLVRDEGKRRLDMRGTAVEVRFEDVRFTYPAAKGGEPNPPVLNGLSFSFRTGETVALVGASGGGKSTAARLLQRFWDVDGGRISINGTDVRELTLENLRDIVTVVPQEVYLFNMSVAENLRLARLSATDAEIREAARRARAEEFIEKLPKGYDTVIGERGLRLSGGEKQRLSIAQAFLKNAPVLVLDEASANLDAENERLINQAVEHLKQGRATLVIAHRISTIRAADRIVMVENGRVAGEGTYAQLMEGCPEFRKLMGDEYAGTEN